MQTTKRQWAELAWLVLCAAILIIDGGCGVPTGTAVVPPKVEPSAAAAQAIELYDKDGSGSLSESELTACPAIKNAREQFDQNSDAQISQDEIAARLERLYGGSVGLLSVDCIVTRQGRPLSGAIVRFTPEPFLGESIQAAVGATDASGTAFPSIPADKLPTGLQKEKMMQPGIFRVEIEHPAVPASNKTLYGAEVDPSRREGATVRIEL